MTDATAGRAALMLTAQILRIIDEQARDSGGTGVLELMEAGLAPAGPEPAELAEARQLAVAILHSLRQARDLARSAAAGEA